MQKRTVWLLLVVVIFVGTSTIVGFYGLRNVVANRLDFIYFARGTQLSKQEADKLEKDLKRDPGSFADRMELLAFYGFKIYKAGLTPEEIASRREHTLWVIRNQPTSNLAGRFEAAFDGDTLDPDGVQQAKTLWSHLVEQEPNDAIILYNAGKFFSWVDDWQKSEELIERAFAVAPDNHEIASSLGGLYWRDARHASTPEKSKSMADRALKVYERALRDTHEPRERLRDLPNAAQAAFESGDYELAAAYSREGLTLALDPEYVASNADAIHYGNIVLGRIALRRGDMGVASAHLLKAAEVRDSPHLATFGPNMMLARELLENGERKSVLEYFDLCGKFWTSDERKLSHWRASVLSGGVPDFGANLHY